MPCASRPSAATPCAPGLPRWSATWPGQPRPPAARSRSREQQAAEHARLHSVPSSEELLSQLETERDAGRSGAGSARALPTHRHPALPPRQERRGHRPRRGHPRGHGALAPEVRPGSAAPALRGARRRARRRPRHPDPVCRRRLGGVAGQGRAGGAGGGAVAVGLQQGHGGGHGRAGGRERDRRGHGGGQAPPDTVRKAAVSAQLSPGMVRGVGRKPAAAATNTGAGGDRPPRTRCWPRRRSPSRRRRRCLRRPSPLLDIEIQATSPGQPAPHHPLADQGPDLAADQRAPRQRRRPRARGRARPLPAGAAAAPWW